MVAINPGATKAFGKENWYFVATIANINAPTAAEINAAGALEITCYLWDDFGQPTQSTNVVTMKRRLCETVQYSRIGITTYQSGEMQYSVDPQAAAASNGKKAYEKFPAGTVGYLVRRIGLDTATAVAAGQFVDVFPVELGPPMPMKMGDGETAEVGATNTYAITSAPAFIKAVA